ncbi:MAG: DUF6468 domain-containing protein, partial [Alphaproteobacteria bacterium]
TIAYCVLLNRRLQVMRSAQSEMITLIQEFDRATVQAKTGISDLRQAGGEIATRLQDQVKRAQALSEDLSFMIDAGERTADKLDGRLQTARRAANPAARVEPRGVGQNVEPGETPATPRSEAENELLQALRRVK